MKNPNTWILSMIYALVCPLVMLPAWGQRAQAQTRLFTLEDAVLGLSQHLKPKGPVQLSWEPETDDLYRVMGEAPDLYWVRRVFPAFEQDTLFSLNDLRGQVPGLDSLRQMPQFQWISRGKAWFRTANRVYTGGRNPQGLWSWNLAFTLPDKAENLDFDGHGRWAYTLENNLWIQVPGQDPWPVTQEQNPHIRAGVAVHREEFGINKGIFFSPTGRYMAYYLMDESMVEDYPIIDWSGSMARSRNIKYPRAGQASHEVRVFVLDTETRKSWPLITEGPRDQYLVSLTWAPNEEEIYVGILNRDQNHFRLNRYDRLSGRLSQTLFEEKHSAYVEPQHPLYFPRGQSEEFIWRSQRDGYTHLYHYTREGKLVRQLTKGPWVVDDIVGFSEASGELIFLAARPSPLVRNLFRLNWSNGEIRPVDLQDGFHSAWISGTGKYVLDYFTSEESAGKYLIHGLSEDYVEAHFEVEDPLKDFQRARVENLEWEAEDGTRLYGKLVLPASLDSQRRYPLIVYVYNGPHVQLVTHRYPASGNLWYEYLAQKGYLVFFMDGRGSARRGRDFEQKIFRQLGKWEIKDQIQGLERIKALPFVDSQRIGVHGWSYGGFMTTSLLIHHPDQFQLGVAGGPVLDWSDYEIMYTERYMDRPQDNPEGYSASRLTDKVEKIQDPLLLIHGTDDDVVLWQHSLKFLKAAVDKGISLDYFVYPGHGHNVRGKDRVHLMKKITDYFDLYLHPASPN